MIAILGHTNTEKGLSEIAESRCERALEIWKNNQSHDLIVTGTFGRHFNTTSKSHFNYLKDYLVAHGVPKDKVTGTYSSNTYEDILGIRKICIDKSITEIIIVTSDFHQKRVAYLCDRILQNIDFKIETVKSENDGKLDNLKKREKQSLKVAKNEVFDFPLYNAPNAEFPKEVYENAHNEHKHYDNLSIVSITGQFVIFGFGINFLDNFMKDINTPQGLWSLIPVSILVIGFVFLLWKLYHRAAKTAGVARKLLRSIELSYGSYGFSSLFRKQKFAKEFFGTVRIVNFSFCLQILVIIFIVINKIASLC